MMGWLEKRKDLGVMTLALCAALLVVPLLEPAHELVNELSVSSSVASRLDAVKKTTPEFVHKKLEAMATLLAQDEMYKAVSNAGNLVGKQKYGSQGQKSSFSAWMSVISNKNTLNNVEKQVKSRLLSRHGGYGGSVWRGIPAKYHNELPALATQAAHEATEEAFGHMRDELIESGEWDKGYLPSGHSLVQDPLKFGGKFTTKLLGEQLAKKQLGHACKKACGQHEACTGYTFNPSQGVCYLKTVNAPTGGFECESDCWYWGKYAGHQPEMQLSLQDARRDLGLEVTDLKVGTGDEIKGGQTATIGYIGTLANGKVFDQGQYTFTFGEGQVIKGDDIGLQGMRVGGKRRLVIPPSLAYGDNGYPGSIPPKATIKFDVQLLGVNPQATASGYKSSSSPGF